MLICIEVACIFGDVVDYKRTNKVYLPMNRVNNDWVTSRGRSPSKLATKKKKLTNLQKEKDRERKREKNKIHCYI